MKKDYSKLRTLIDGALPFLTNGKIELESFIDALNLTDDEKTATFKYLFQRREHDFLNAARVTRINYDYLAKWGIVRSVREADVLE